MILEIRAQLIESSNQRTGEYNNLNLILYFSINRTLYLIQIKLVNSNTQIQKNNKAQTFYKLIANL